MVTNYTIVYTEIERNITALETDVIGTSYNVTNLMEYERYTFVVIALTDKGEGPKSMPLDVLTAEHCKFATR